jgi:hypothetical protein
MIRALQLMMPVLLYLMMLYPVTNAAAQQVFRLDQPSVNMLGQEDTRLPGARFEWEAEKLPKPESIRARGTMNTYEFTGEEAISFTGLVVGWSGSDNQIQPDQFQLQIRSRNIHESWSDWVSTSGYLALARQ